MDYIIRETFHCPWVESHPRNGQKFIVLETIKEHPFPVYRIRFADGFVMRAFAEQIFEKKNASKQREATAGNEV